MVDKFNGMVGDFEQDLCVPSLFSVCFWKRFNTAYGILLIKLLQGSILTVTTVWNTGETGDINTPMDKRA